MTKDLGTEIASAYESLELAEDFDPSNIKDSVKTLSGSSTHATPRERLAAKKQILGYVEAGMEMNRDTPKFFKYAALHTKIETILMGAD